MLYILTQEELDKLKADKTGEEEVKKRVNEKLDSIAKDFTGLFTRHGWWFENHPSIVQAIVTILKEARK